MIEKTDELASAGPKLLAEQAVMTLIEKKALNVKMFYVAENTTITDYYVNVTGRSLTHVASLADELAYVFENRGRNPYRIEGKRGNSWILVDFGSVIVNVFDSQARDFYNFDRLLSAECEQNIDYLVKAVDEKLN